MNLSHDMKNQENVCAPNEDSDQSRSTQGHHCNKLGSTRSLNAAYQLLRSSTFWYRSRRFLRFLPFMGWSGDLDRLNKLSLPYLVEVHMKFDFDWPSGF